MRPSRSGNDRQKWSRLGSTRTNNTREKKMGLERRREKMEWYEMDATKVPCIVLLVVPTFPERVVRDPSTYIPDDVVHRKPHCGYLYTRGLATLLDVFCAFWRFRRMDRSFYGYVPFVSSDLFHRSITHFARYYSISLSELCWPSSYLEMVPIQPDDSCLAWNIAFFYIDFYCLLLLNIRPYMTPLYFHFYFLFHYFNNKKFQIPSITGVGHCPRLHFAEDPL